MCGIGGVVVAMPTEQLDRTLAAMAGAMAHRGPDDEGTAVVAHGSLHVGLVARRLAIQDLSAAGHQPMMSERTGSWLCLNGEVYNVRELRLQLESHGYRFRGGSDTEVLLAAYDEWGPGCLEHLRGMFAFAVWDAREQRLFLARDRLGIKPLYYRERPGAFAFASELRTLLTAGLADGRLSSQGLASYLAWGAVQEPLSIVEDVLMLPAGHYAVWKDDRLQISPYWSLMEAFQHEAPATDRSVAAEELRSLLVEAVRLHLVSDVPLGVFLSGGLDSSSLVGLVTMVAGQPPRTASVVFPQQRYSEGPLIRTVSERFGTQHAQVELDDAAARRELPLALAAMDQPSFDAVNTYIVSKLARDSGLTVALSGLGGDELFAGYDTFRIVPALRKARRLVPAAAAPAAAGLARLAWGGSDRAEKLARWLGRSDRGLTAYSLRRELFAPDVLAHLSPTANGGSGATEAAEPDLDDINGTSYLELSRYMRNVLLRDTDVMSMAHGLEVRVPFLDHRLVEFVAGLPGKLKRNGGAPKPLLTEAVADLLPGEVVHRKKMGFTLPFAEWLRGPPRHEVESALRDPRFGGQVAEALDHEAIVRIWDRFQQGKAEWVRPWSLYVLKVWGERHLPAGSAAIRRGRVA